MSPRLLGTLFALLALGTALPTGAQAPRIDAINPTEGPIAGGTLVTITGAGFTAGSAVTFNRTAANNVQVIDAGTLRVTAPPLGSGPFATGLAMVRVTNASGSGYGEYLYKPPTFAEIGIGDITTIAGVGNFNGDGRDARQAIVWAEGVAVDGAGNLYIGDEPNGRIRKVGTDGRITTIAGTGAIGYSGDGGPAIDAQFNAPDGIAVDRAGNVYLGDMWDNHRVRRIDAATGIVRTIAGTGQRGFSGDGGPATQAQLNHPTSVALDAQGNVYFVDLGNQRVRRIDTAGTIRTIAGNGTAGFSGDGGPATQAALNMDFIFGTVAVDSRGNVFVADLRNQRIRRIDPGGTITTVAGGGNAAPTQGSPATSANTIFNSVAIDMQDRLVFTDPTRIWRLEPGGTLSKVAGTGTSALTPDGVRAVDAAIIPLEIAVGPNGDIFFSEKVAGRVRRIDAATGILTTAAGVGPATVGDNGSPAIAASFNDVGFIALDTTGNLYETDPRGSMRIRRIDTGGRISTIAGIGVESIRGLYFEGVAALSAAVTPRSVAVDPGGMVTYSDFCAVRRIGADGRIRTIVGSLTNPQDCGFGGDGGPATSAKLGAEQDVIRLDAQGNIFIADVFNHRVRRVDAATGVITTFAGSGRSSTPGGYDPDPTPPLFSGDGGPANQATLGVPSDIALDAQGNLCIGDTGHGRIRCVDPAGTIRTRAADVAPYRIAFDRAGNLYLGDSFRGVIQKLDTNGGLSTIAGVRGSRGFSGDGGPATQARIDYASGLAVDASGNVLFFDGDNRRIRVIKQAATPAANTPGALSGLWWNPAESGWGMSVTQRGTIAFAAWYTYDAAGAPKWYVASRCVLSSASTTGSCSDTLYEVTGPAYFGVPFDTASVHVAPAGTLQLAFSSASNGTMTYTVAGQTRTVPITRQLFGSGSAPSVDYTDLWWNASESGWGAAITQQGSTMFLAWYVYSSSGKPIWYVASDCRVNGAGTGCTGTAYRTTGSAFGPTFNPSAVQVFPVGTVVITFNDPNNGTLQYTVDGVSGTKTITRQVF